jgi:hypothetical protein
MSREIVENVLGRDMTREIWSGNYEKALPVSVQNFDLSAVLPAVFFMFRYGQRRGKGKFLDAFAGDQGTPLERRRSATIARVAEVLGQLDSIEGFRGEDGQAILGDLLLCYCLENTGRALGRNEKIQRVAPAHYMASWVDLPEPVVHLRKVPEMVVAMLTNQDGEVVRQNQEDDRTWFAVGRGFESNILLRAFSGGIRIRGELASRTSDKFDEGVKVGIDQLLMIRLAQQLGEAPDKVRGGEGGSISNQRPIAERAAHHFSEDIRRFVRAYASVIPRQSFVNMQESCMAVGLTTILNSVIELMLEWAEIGGIRKKHEQRPAPLFVDVSNGTDRRLRALSEQCFDDFIRRVERFPAVLMAARLLDWSARYNRKLKEYAKKTKPYATDWLNLLGDILVERHGESAAIMYDIEQKTAVLAERLKDEAPEASELLENSYAYPNPVWRLAEALTLLQKHLFLNDCVDSCLLINRPNGLAVKRRAPQTDFVTGKKTREIRSMVFTDAVLDYLVHLHLLRSGNHQEGLRVLSFKEFLYGIRERYGFYVDTTPSGMSVSNDLLQANRTILERRLRDLGLLSGVNDAEAMKRLKPRFNPVKEDLYEAD